jgi:hypothetical protein
MALKKEFIFREDMACNDPLRISPQNGVHKQKGRSMGQEGFNVLRALGLGFYDFYLHIRLLYLR